jgi:hypothetical protein
MNVLQDLRLRVDRAQEKASPKRLERFEEEDAVVY